MSSKVSTTGKTPKSGTTRNRVDSTQNGEKISPVMQKVRGLLEATSAAKTLAFLLDEDVRYCEKLLCGQRRENATILAKLLCVEEHSIGQEVLLTIGEGRKVSYIQSVRVRADLRAMEKQVSAAAQSLAEMRQKAVEA
ncbi:MAG: hypothetical protein Q8L13_11590 [Bradyrhizobium sp.]|uniref:hypothetical protein n=1 Tax=Bradyrhizobium sp. TaxID=376 RepID=UPI002731E987|nr:hypothetical protein [Bradyrhizobium sp.]MDP1866967.1 hypothetical protein [Bradyrhizobium sp.]